MPTYCYTNEDGETIERRMSMKKVRKSIRVKGVKFTRDIAAENAGYTDTPGAWPMKSDAAGVHPSQIGEAREHAAKVGVPTDFTPDGRAIFTSRLHRKSYCEAHGLYDRNGGYGDPRRRGIIDG